MTSATEIMTKNPKFFYSSDLITHAVDVFLKHKVGVVPVLTPTHEILGAVTETSILKMALFARKKDEILLQHQELLEPITVIFERDDANQVVQALLKSVHHRVFVQDNSARICGVISPKDLLPVIIGASTDSETVQREVQRLRKQISDFEEVKKEIPIMRRHIQMLESLMDSSHFLVVSTDNNNCIQAFNAAFPSEVGLEAKDLNGSSIFDYFAKESLPELRTVFEHIKKSGGHRTSYLVLLTKGGTRQKVEVICRLRTEGSGVALLIRAIDPDELIRLLNGVIKNG